MYGIPDTYKSMVWMSVGPKFESEGRYVER